MLLASKRLKGGFAVGNDFNSAIFKTNIGLAALLDLLEEKGFITEDEYKQKYEQTQKVFVNLLIEEINKSLN